MESLLTSCSHIVRASLDPEPGQLYGKPISCKAELCPQGHKDVPWAGISAQARIRLALLQGELFNYLKPISDSHCQGQFVQTSSHSEGSSQLWGFH